MSADFVFIDSLVLLCIAAHCHMRVLRPLRFLVARFFAVCARVCFKTARRIMFVYGPTKKSRGVSVKKERAPRWE